jgi:hypothetical protein
LQQTSVASIPLPTDLRTVHTMEECVRFAFLSDHHCSAAAAGRASDGGSAVEALRLTSTQRRVDVTGTACAKRAVLSFRNAVVDSINNFILDMHLSPTESAISALSFDQLAADDDLYHRQRRALGAGSGTSSSVGGRGDRWHSTERIDDNQAWMHCCNPCSAGVPHHQLRMKKGALMTWSILRNIQPAGGLMNGTRVEVVDCTRHRVVVVKVLTGPDAARGEHKIVAIPRITFTVNPAKGSGTRFIRLQFPLRLAWAMTVNKAQGKTLERVCLDLRQSAFCHG